MDEGLSSTPGSAKPIEAAVCRSFALGWQLSRLFEGPLHSTAPPVIEEDLPGLSHLPGSRRVELGIGQVDAGLRGIGDFLGKESPLPDVASLRQQLKEAAGKTEVAREAILSLHVELLIKLSAGDFRCGKAYGLGRALADTCASSQAGVALAGHLERHRVAEIRGWLDDLKSVLPTHGATVVTNSLGAWVEWAGEHSPVALSDEHATEVSRALHTQGQRWRALLSGEKEAEDALELSDYVKVASTVLRRSRELGDQVLRTLWPPLLLATGLFALGITLILASNGAARVIAGLGTVVAALGFAWGTVGSAMTKLTRRVESPIWGGACDQAIAERITVLPELSLAAVHSPPILQPPSDVDDTIVQRVPATGSSEELKHDALE